jgi:lysine 2,3-aminomutase
MARFTFPTVNPPAEVSVSDWADWTWQLRHSLKSQADFARVFTLSENEKAAFEGGRELFNVRTTPYYASLAGNFEEDPLRRILMPHALELETGAQQMPDPLAEARNQAAPRVIHRYSDRVLFLITDICSVYCRFCTRKHFTGQEQAFVRPAEYELALNYIRSHPGIREVILSGGDPLTVSDSQLDRVLTDLRAIDHIEIIRIGTRMPVVAPMRVTDSLVKIMRHHAPVFLMTHFNHPRELTLQSSEALGRLVDGGIPVMNQMVLLNGVNNHPALIQALSRRLLFLRVKPYYLFQCDPSVGTDHLRTSIEDSLQIQRELWGHLSGLAMPSYAVDIPDGGGKTVLTPDFEISRGENSRRYRGWDGVEAEYVNPAADRRRVPADSELYLAEWELLKAAKSRQVDLG